MNNTTRASIMTRMPPPNLVPWFAAFGTLAVFIVSGNALAIAVLTRKKMLSRRTSYFLLSLSVADLLVGLLSVPTFIFQLLTFSRIVTPTFEIQTGINVVRASDVFASLASTFTLTIIALERFYAITFPLKHRVSDKKMYYFLVSSVWILAGVLSSLYFFYTYKLLDHRVFFYFMMVTFFLSLFIMLVAYLTIWFRVTRTISLDRHKHSGGSMSNTESNAEEKLRDDDTELALKPLAPKPRHKTTFRISKNGKVLHVTSNKEKDRMRSRAESEKKLAMTLFIVTAVFVVTWLPFQVINLFYFTCGMACPAPPPIDVIYFCKFLNYTNSLINPVVYSLRLPEFRAVLKTIVFKKFKFLFCLES